MLSGARQNCMEPFIFAPLNYELWPNTVFFKGLWVMGRVSVLSGVRVMVSKCLSCAVVDIYIFKLGFLHVN